MPNETPPPIEIFRAGTHTSAEGRTLTFAAADLAAAAAAYDPARHEAPLVVGHPATDAPAYGWIKGLRADGDRLLALPQQVDPALAELVRQGRFKKVSAKFWLPTSPGNPTPGTLALRHVGLLGATPPAVKGLRSVAFGDDDADTVALETDLVHFAAPEDIIMADPAQEQRAADVARREQQLAQQEAALQQRTAALETQTAAFAEQQRAARQAADRTAIEALVKAGKVLPREQAALGALASFLDAETGTIEFAEGGAVVKKPAKATLLDLLAGRPAIVNFAEVARGDDAGAGDDPHALARAATDYQAAEAKAGRQVTIAQAVGHVRRRA